ncbi:hypothetical protein ACP4OV_026643 [Aristida adscensionis]
MYPRLLHPLRGTVEAKHSVLHRTVFFFSKLTTTERRRRDADGAVRLLLVWVNGNLIGYEQGTETDTNRYGTIGSSYMLCESIDEAAHNGRAEGMAQLLPDDVLADALRRLPPRGLAVSRCVCAAWRRVVDERRLLRADLLPRSLAGLFIYYTSPLGSNVTLFFSRPPSTEPAMATSKSYSYPPLDAMYDHCNGLVLLHDDVLNPATGRQAPLPESPPPNVGLGYFYQQQMYLVFDPAESSHYQVFLIPRVPPNRDFVLTYNLEGNPIYGRRHMDRALRESEWPPSPYILNVFSSLTGRWEKRSFDRDGEAAGTVEDMESDQREFFSFNCTRHAVYFRDALYVHCEHDFVMRISLSKNKYQVIKPPTGMLECEDPMLHIGKSENGVYAALMDYKNQLQVWILVESRGKLEWKLKHNRVLLKCARRVFGPWHLHQVSRQRGGENEALLEKESHWNSDDENILNNEESGEEHCSEGLEILGFHPYKEIVFFHGLSNRGLAYHLNSSKLEDLGDTRANGMEEIGRSFPYTPCWIEELPGSC